MPAPRYRAEIDDVIAALVPVVGDIEHHLVFVTCLNEDGSFGDSNCFASENEIKTNLPMEAVFALPLEKEAAAVMVTSRSTGGIEDVHPADIEFTNKLIDYSRKAGIPLAEHVLVKDLEFRLLSETISLG